MKHRFLFFPFIICAFIPLQSHAEWQVESAIGVRQVRMIESDRSGRQLVKEHGTLPGAELRALYVAKHSRVEFKGEAYASSIDYDGQLQNGVAFSTDTRTKQLRFGVEAGHHVTTDTLLIAGVERDYWRRHILGQGAVMGLDERYSSWRLLVGGETSIVRAAWGHLRLKGLLVAASPEKFVVRVDNQLFDETRLHTESALGARIALDTMLLRHPHLGIEANFEWMRIPRSGDAVLRMRGVPIGSLAQPEHVRQAFGLKLKYRF